MPFFDEDTKMLFIVGKVGPNKNNHVFPVTQPTQKNIIKHIIMIPTLFKLHDVTGNAGLFLFGLG
jgi:hypothetical protein